MCAEKIQRIIMAVVLSVVIYLISIGNFLGMLFGMFMVVMILVWAITDFCPSIWILKKIVPPCYGK